MASVDDRIVRMEFDNASFERKINTTLASIGQLDKALKLTGATKGLTDVQDAAGRFHMGSMGTHIEGISAKFLALSTVAITALANITSHALMAGAQVAKAFTLDPVISGFQEYETQLNSVQTILANTASKGTTLDQVNDALQKLNEYSDQTIYNFGQMAKNIGTFTAAGVDLDTSVQSIKGIANLAAMSGSNAEQASNAMYQLSQAIATGSLKLIDWNSVVNAGMGGEAFKTALYETGKAMGTLTDAPVGQTFKEWEDASGGFRGSLESGWVTAEVLTTTLAGFTGDLTEEMLIQKGYTQAVASSIVKTAQMAKAAATEVKTFTQLVGTVKEAVGTGWADSFKIVIGNFTEAKELWTSVNNSVGEFVSKNADARNQLLQGWKDLGGRNVLIMSLSAAFHNLGEILKPIKEAFREVFPPMTAQRLFELTHGLADLANAMKPSEQTIENLKRIFKGLFSALEIGWTIIKAGAGFILDLVTAAGVGSGGFLAFAAKIGDFFTTLNESLVEGGGIVAFFKTLGAAVTVPIEVIKKLKDAIVNFFSGADAGTSDKIGESVGRLGESFEGLKEVLGRLGDRWESVFNAFKKVGSVLAKVWEVISDFFSSLGSKIAEIMGSGNFDKVFDGLNTALLGGITAILYRFMKTGSIFNVGGGFLDKIGESFEQLTGILKSMQTKVKAEALMKIAAAIGILTASVVVLSLIDSVALTKSLAAMSIGFGQLMASFAIISKMNMGPSSAASFSLVSVGMIGLSTAMLILAGAIKVLSTIDPGDLATGLAGIGASIGIMLAATLLLSKNAGSVLIGSAALVVMSGALVIMAGAVKLFSLMNTGDIAHGLIGISAALLVIGVAMNLMPLNMPITAAGLVLVGVGLNIIAGALAIFGNMEWATIGRGLVAIAGALVVIGLAMHLMPINMPVTAAGLILVGISLNLIGKALSSMGEMSWGEIAKGLVAMAGALLILGIATYAMSGSIGGAIAIGVVAVSLGILAKVLKIFADIGWSELFKGLAGIAISLALLGATAFVLSPLIPALFALAAALALLGAAFVLFGAGAFLLAKAFELIAKAGKGAAESIVGILESIGKALPALAKGFAEGMLDIIKILGEAAPLIATTIGKLISAMVDKMVELIPKFVETFETIVDAGIKFLVEKAPVFIQTGIFLLMQLLAGIRNNMYEITTIVVDIILEFIRGLTDNVDQLISAGLTFFLTFLSGIYDNIFMIVDYVTQIITTFITEMGNHATEIVTAGANALISFVSGIANNIFKIVEAATNIITTFITVIANSAVQIANAATNALIVFIFAIAANLWRVISLGSDIIVSLITGVGQKIVEIGNAAVGVILLFIKTISDNLQNIITAGTDLIIKFVKGIGDASVKIVRAALDTVVTFMNELAKVIREKDGDLKSAGRNLIGAVLDGMTMGLASKAKNVADGVVNVAKNAVSSAKSALQVVGDPYSLVFMGIGESMMNGMTMALNADRSVEASAIGVVERATDTFRNSLSTISESLENLNEFNPTITPVLDLTRVEAEAVKINDYIQASNVLTPSYSLNQARTIASSTNPQQENPVNAPGDSSQVSFQQIINAPTQLSTTDIYKQTRNQITMAKEELSIP